MVTTVTRNSRSMRRKLLYYGELCIIVYSSELPIGDISHIPTPILNSCKDADVNPNEKGHSRRALAYAEGVRKKIRKQRKSLDSQLRDSRRRSRDRWPTVKQLYLNVSAKMTKFKKVAERSRDSRRRSRDRWPTVKQLFFDVSTKMGKF